MMKNITYISIDKLYPHPDNPRKDLGDISELADSIKAKGIMQNLTVVEHEEGYRVVIGHRRMAAAKQIGLTELPCVIVEMDQKEQVQTMLLENIQRADLTAYEQAQGFQMMMDLGASIADIVKDTGFSESTVRHRLKLNELDQDVLKEKSKGNISMADYIALEQLKNPDHKNKALKEIGTNNFRFKLNELIEVETREKNESLLREKLSPYISVSEKSVGWPEYAYSFHIIPSELDNIDSIVEKFKELNEPVMFISYGRANIYEKRQDVANNNTTADPETIKIEQERKERVAKLEEICKNMKKTREQYMETLSVKQAKDNLGKIIKISINDVFTTYCDIDDDIANRIIGYEHSEDGMDWEKAEKERRAYIKARTQKYPEVTFAQMVYAALEVLRGPYTYDGAFDINYASRLPDVYCLLNVLGYEMSDEEQKIMDGTHELYLKKESEEQS